MKTLAILCICIATCLYFPLPQRRSPKLPPSEPKADVEIAARVSSSGEILQTLEIIRLGISSGMTISDALQYAQKHSPRAASQEIEQVLNQFRMGFPLSRGLEEVATANPRWRSISGSPITDQLADVEFVLQSSLDTEKLKRIKSVAVKSVLPLGACFLPAFILLAVIPIIAGLLGGLTQ
jgi:pilus assembly protein TadC